MSTVKTLIDMCRVKCSTDAEVARRLGVPRSHITDWRKGARPISGESVAALCDLMELSGEEAREWVAVAMIENPKNRERAAMLRRALFGCWALGVAALGTPNDAKARNADYTDRASGQSIHRRALRALRTRWADALRTGHALLHTT
jgi:transcriptional regulator with XRE-family HTH domain